MFDAMVLFGGGLDAAAMVELHWQRSRTRGNLYLTYVTYGAKAEPGERVALAHFAAKYGHPFSIIPVAPWVFPPNPITDSPMTDEHQDDYLMGRNLLFASLALPFARRNRVPRIWLGAAPIDPASGMQHWAGDMMMPFVRDFNDLVARAYGVEAPLLEAPLLRYARKEHYVKQAFQTCPELFEKTTSCYQSREPGKPCGKCAHCIYREELKRFVKES